MRRPAGVTVAAVVLGLMTLMGVLGVMLSLAASMLLPHLPVSGVQFRALLVCSNLLALAFFVYCAWTVIDLFRLRRWARISAIVIGSLLFLVSLLAGLAILAARRFASLIPQSGPTPVDVTQIFVVMAAFYFLIALIGLWWIVYFSLPSVRSAFVSPTLMVTNPDILPPGGEAQIPAPPVGTPGWRVVLVVWACLMFLGVIGLPMVLFMHIPLFLFGAILTGPAEWGVLLIMFAAQVLLGIGLIRKWKFAWYLGLVWQIYAIGYTLTFLIPGMWNRFISYQEQLASRWATPGSVQLPMDALYHGPFMAICFALGIAVIVLFSVALFRCREDYLGA
jgi:hypothetical protein